MTTNTTHDDTNTISAEAESGKQSQQAMGEGRDTTPAGDKSSTSPGDGDKNENDTTTSTINVEKDDNQGDRYTIDVKKKEPADMEVDPQEVHIEDETKSQKGGVKAVPETETPVEAVAPDSDAQDQETVETLTEGITSTTENPPNRPTEIVTLETAPKEGENRIETEPETPKASETVVADEEQASTTEAKNVSKQSTDPEPNVVDVDQEANHSGDPPSPTGGGKNGKAFFPMKLYDIVSDEKNVEIIKWLPGGKAFIIVDKKRFANEVLPKHFQQSQFTSFTRKLSRWRFTRVPRGPFIGAYYNKLFLKGHRSLCWHMRCKNENMGKIKLDRKISETIKEMSSLDQATRAAMMHPVTTIPAPPPTTTTAGGMTIHQPFPQGFAPMPQTHITAVPPHLAPQIPNGAHNTFQVGVNPLNTQILAIEGRLRELQNARSAEAFMYEQQQKAFIAQQAMDDIAYANHANQSRSIMEARAAMAINPYMGDPYNNPIVVRPQGEQQAPAVGGPVGASHPVVQPQQQQIAPPQQQHQQQHQQQQQQQQYHHQHQQHQQGSLPPPGGPPQSMPGAPMPPPDGDLV